MIKCYLLKVLYIPLILIISIFGVLQNHSVQNKLITACVPEGYSITIAKTKGLFPFSFSTDNITLKSKDVDVNIKDFSFIMSKSFLSVKDIKAQEVSVITKGESDFSVSNFKCLLPFVAQKLIKRASIKQLLCDKNQFSDIDFHYDKLKKTNNISLNSPYGKISGFWQLNKNQFNGELTIEENLIKWTSNLKDAHVNLDYICQGNKFNFDGKFESNKLNGVITIPYGNLKLDSSFWLENNILNATLHNKMLGLSANARFDPNKFVIFVDKLNIGGFIKLKPFTIKDFSDVSEIIMSLKKGTINMRGINISKPLFSLGSFFFKDVALEQFPLLNCSGVLNGTTVYKSNQEVIELNIKNLSYGEITTPLLKIHAKYDNSKLDGNVDFDILKLKNSLKFNVSLNNWLPSKNSQINSVLKGALNLSKYKLPSKQIISGDFIYNINATGKLYSPKLNGTISFNKGVYINTLAGIYIKNISLSGEVADNFLNVKSLYAEDDTKQKGTIKGSGKIAFAPKEKTNLVLKVNNFKAVDQNWLECLVCGEVNLEGDIFKQLNINGKLYSNTPTVDITSIVLMNVRNIDIFNQTDSSKAASKKRGFDIPIKVPVDIDLKFKPELKIIGMGLDSTWSGGIVAKGDITDVKYAINAQLIKGKVDFIDNKFKIKKGTILINNDRNDIFLSAEKKVEKVIVGVSLDQQKDRTKFNFYSNPYLSDKDIMSYMLFDKPTSEISAGEGLVLLSAMSKLSGKSGFSVLSKMKAIFGIDSISIKKNINSNKEEYNAISIGKKIGKFKVSVDQGSAKDSAGVVVEANVAKNLKVSVDLSGRDAAAAGFLWSKRY